MGAVQETGKAERRQRSSTRRHGAGRFCTSNNKRYRRIRTEGCAAEAVKKNKKAVRRLRESKHCKEEAETEKRNSGGRREQNCGKNKDGRERVGGYMILALLLIITFDYIR